MSKEKAPRTPARKGTTAAARTGTYALDLPQPAKPSRSSIVGIFDSGDGSWSELVKDERRARPTV